MTMQMESRYHEYDSIVVAHSGFVSYISDMETYDLLHITKEAMELFGLKKPEEYLGQKCYKVIMGLDEPCPFCTNCHLGEEGHYRWERYNENIGKWFDRKSHLVYIDGRACHLEIGQDITARKEELSLLSGQLTMEDVLFRCLKTLTNEKDIQVAVNRFLEAIGGYYQADRVYIFEIDNQEKVVNNTFEWVKEGLEPHIEKWKNVPVGQVHGWHDRLLSEGVFYIDSVEEELDHDSMLYHAMKEDGIESFMMASLLYNKELVGMLGLNNPKKKAGNLTLLSSVSEFVQAEFERRLMVRELEKMSYTDTLTGIKNRNYYNRLLKEYESRTPKSLGIIYVDINGMRGINDLHGYHFGDHIIKKTASMVKEITSGVVMRIGGDEFVVFNEDVIKDDFQSEVMALRKAFDEERECNVSIGCIWREEEENVHLMLQQAHELVAAEKQSYYHTILQEGRSENYAGFSHEVIKEVEEGRFIVYYQPQVDIKTGKITGAEALVRKLDENGKLIPPNKFIPLYEMEGVISHVDLFVLQSACAAMHQWSKQGYEIHLSINFSRVTLLEPGIVNTIKGICEQHEVNPSSITIEVTESISKMDHDSLRELIEEINSAGFTISLDDFGSQYSNLSILSSMDFDEIKFDKSLIESLEHNQKSRVVMENTVKMCRELKGTTSLAEGIETKGQLELLMGYDCNMGQGFYFSKPVPEGEFRDMLDSVFVIEED